MTVTKERAKADKAVRPRRREFAGTPEQVRHARDFVSRALGEYEIADEAVLMVSELVTNAILHTESSYGLGTFTVVVYAGEDRVRVEVEDAGSRMVPEVLPDEERDEFGGRGLSIVDQLSSRWGHYTLGSGRSRVVWFELDSR